MDRGWCLSQLLVPVLWLTKELWPNSSDNQSQSLASTRCEKKIPFIGKIATDSHSLSLNLKSVYVVKVNLRKWLRKSLTYSSHIPLTHPLTVPQLHWTLFNVAVGQQIDQLFNPPWEICYFRATCLLLQCYFDLVTSLPTLLLFWFLLRLQRH